MHFSIYFSLFPSKKKTRVKNSKYILNFCTPHTNTNYRQLNVKLKIRDCSVGIATYYGLDDRMIGGSNPGVAGNFSLRRRNQTGSGAHLAYYTMGTGGSFLGVTRPGREVDHSSSTSAEVKEFVELYLHSPNTP
jgi:hypothetical protein